MLRSKCGLLVSAESIFFEERLPTQQKSRAFFCLGNADQHHVKVQFVLKQGTEKVAMSTDPQVVVPKLGYTCEFQVFVRPLCSCVIDESAAVHWTDEEASRLPRSLASGYETCRSPTATLLVVDGMDDTIAAMRGLLDAEQTFQAFRAFDQQTERLRSKAAVARCSVLFVFAL